MTYEMVKETYKQYVVFQKIGIFYEVYGNDTYILNYLFNYQSKPYKNTTKTGFPVSGLTKIINVLERKK